MIIHGQADTRRQWFMLNIQDLWTAFPNMTLLEAKSMPRLDQRHKPTNKGKEKYIQAKPMGFSPSLEEEKQIGQRKYYVRWASRKENLNVLSRLHRKRRHLTFPRPPFIIWDCHLVHLMNVVVVIAIRVIQHLPCIRIIRPLVRL